MKTRNNTNKLATVLALAVMPAWALAAGTHGATDDHGASAKPAAASGGHHDMAAMHGDAHASMAGEAGDGAKVSRTIPIEMDDTMRFKPGNLTVKAGKTVRFFIVNKDEVPHEMVIGTADELEEHAEMMKKMPGMVHKEANQFNLAPGQRGGIVWQFAKAGTVTYAASLPVTRRQAWSGRLQSTDRSMGHGRDPLWHMRSSKHLTAGHSSCARWMVGDAATRHIPYSRSGARWRRAAATGLSGEITRLAVHPDDPAMVVVGTSTGLYLSRDGAEILSRDGAEMFSQLQGGQRIFAVAVEPSGDAIWYGTYSEKAKLVMRTLMPKVVERELPLPAMHGDAVAFIAFNPAVKDEVAITTTRRNIFFSRNNGKDWIQIVHEGEPDA